MADRATSQRRLRLCEFVLELLEFGGVLLPLQRGEVELHLDVAQLGAGRRIVDAGGAGGKLLVERLLLGLELLDFLLRRLDTAFERRNARLKARAKFGLGLAQLSRGEDTFLRIRSFGMETADAPISASLRAR